MRHRPKRFHAERGVTGNLATQYFFVLKVLLQQCNGLFFYSTVSTQYTNNIHHYHILK